MQTFSFTRGFYPPVCALLLGIFTLTSQAADTQINKQPLIPSSTLTLRDALGASLRYNPQLTGYEFRQQALVGEAKTAALRPEMQLATDLENVVGSGELRGLDGGELTLSLSSVIELGNQRDARRGVVTARQEQLAAEQRLATLDLLTQVTRAFIALVAAQEQLALRREAVQLAKQLLPELSRQVQSGLTPEAELLRAKAALARAEIDLQRAEVEAANERVTLSTFWADTTPDFTLAKADLYAFPVALSLAQLSTQLTTNPDLALLASEVQVRAAEVRAAQSAGRPALEWSAGVRRFQATDDSALVVGLSVPLGASARATGATMTARANQQIAEQEQGSAHIQLEATLGNLYQAHQQALAEVNSLRTTVLPTLRQAAKATQTAFDQGRYGYLELRAAQVDLLDAQTALIEAAARVHLLATDMQRVTGAAIDTLSPLAIDRTIQP